MDLVLLDPPGEPLLTTAEAKAQLRVDFGDEDGLIDNLVAAANAWLDGYSGILGRALVTQTWRLYFDYFFADWRIALPLPPLQSVVQIQYVDNNGATQTVDPTLYQVLDGSLAAVQPVYGQIWPIPRLQARAAWVDFVAGYGTAAEVPQSVKAAALLMVSHLYVHRDAVVGVDARDSSTPLPLGVDALLAPLRSRRF